jgi:hypothetical protein
MTGYNRKQSLDITPVAEAGSVTFTSPNIRPIAISSQAVISNGVEVSIKAPDKGTGQIMARLGGSTGPALQVYETHSFAFTFENNGTVPIIKQFSDNSSLITSIVKVDPLYPGHEIEITAFAGSSVFEETGNTTFWACTDDFDENSQLFVYLVGWANEDLICHRVHGPVREVE